MMSHAALKFANKKREDFAVSDAEVVRRGRPETPPFCSCLVIPCFISSSFLLAGYFHYVVAENHGSLFVAFRYAVFGPFLLPFWAKITGGGGTLPFC
ncbi:hypothetical protein QQP08_019842 [Theobroma cacao]|nr:hypothetical protein QQP08_019842 [Theobroma cacao]